MFPSGSAFGELSISPAIHVFIRFFSLVFDGNMERAYSEVCFCIVYSILDLRFLFSKDVSFYILGLGGFLACFFI